MAFDAHSNFGYSTVATAPAPAASGTTLTVAAGEGARFPAAPFNCTVWPAGVTPTSLNAEIIRVTSKGGGDNWTIVRTAETGAPARTILVGDQIANTVTVKIITDLETSIPSTVGLISAINISAGTTSNNLSAVTFSNSNGVSFGLNGSVLTGTVATNYQAPGAYLTTAMLSNAVTLSNINVSAGTTSQNLSAIVFSNSNALSFGLSGSTITGSYTVPTVTNSSWTVSDAATSGTVARLAFTNLNGLTLSLSTGAGGSHTIVGSYTVPAAQTTQSAIKGFGASNTGNTAGNTGLSTGIDWVLAGSNNITVSESTAAGGPNTLWVSGPTLGGAQTGISGIQVSDTTYTSGTVTFRNANGISFGSSGAQGISASYTVPTQSVQTLGIYGSNNTTGQSSSSTYDARSLSFVGDGIVSVGWSNSSLRISATVAAQTNQTLGIYASSNTTLTSSGTLDARSLSFRGIGVASVGYSAGEVLISVPAGGGGITNINISAGTTSNNLSNVTFADSNGISWGLNASTITATVSTYSTVGTATTVKAVASANSVGTITRWAAEDHAHAGIGAVGISTSGNTAGTTGSEQGTYWFQGGNNIVVSQITSNNGSHTLVLSGSNAFVGLNTAETNVTWTVNSSGISLNAGGYAGTVSGATNASVTVNTAGVSVNVPMGTNSIWPDVFPIATAVQTYNSGSTSQGAGGASTQTGYTFSLYAVPMQIVAPVAFSELRLGVSNTRSAGGTGSVTHLFSYGIYTNNASTLSKVWEGYAGIVFSQNSVTAQTFKVFTVTTGSNSVGGGGGFAGLNSGTVYSSQGNISSNSQIDSTPALRFLRVDSGVASTLTAGQYWAVLGFCSVSSSSNVYSCVGILQSNVMNTSYIPDLGRENSTQTSNYLPAHGAISTTFTSVSNAATWFPLPASIPISNMSLSNSIWFRSHFGYLRNLT